MLRRQDSSSSNPRPTRKNRFSLETRKRQPSASSSGGAPGGTRRKSLPIPGCSTTSASRQLERMASLQLLRRDSGTSLGRQYSDSAEAAVDVDRSLARYENWMNHAPKARGQSADGVPPGAVAATPPRAPEWLESGTLPLASRVCTDSIVADIRGLGSPSDMQEARAAQLRLSAGGRRIQRRLKYPSSPPKQGGEGEDEEPLPAAGTTPPPALPAEAQAPAPAAVEPPRTPPPPLKRSNTQPDMEEDSFVGRVRRSNSVGLVDHSLVPAAALAAESFSERSVRAGIYHIREGSHLAKVVSGASGAAATGGDRSACGASAPEARGLTRKPSSCLIREGSKLEAIINSLERQTGIDLDGDGDVGLPGHSCARGAAEAPAAAEQRGGCVQRMMGAFESRRTARRPSATPIREGTKLESIVNSLERQTGVDLDGDGDVGLPGHENPHLEEGHSLTKGPPRRIVHAADEEEGQLSKGPPRRAHPPAADGSHPIKGLPRCCLAADEGSHSSKGSPCCMRPTAADGGSQATKGPPRRPLSREGSLKTMVASLKRTGSSLAEGKRPASSHASPSCLRLHSRRNSWEGRGSEVAERASPECGGPAATERCAVRGGGGGLDSTESDSPACTGGSSGACVEVGSDKADGAAAGATEGSTCERHTPAAKLAAASGTWSAWPSVTNTPRYERILAELLGKNAIGSISCSYANDDLAELTEFEYPPWWYDGTPFEVAGAT